MPQTSIADVYAKSVSELLRQKEKAFIELFQQQPWPYAPFERKDVKMSKGVIVRMLSPDKKYFQEFSSLDAPALTFEGWTAMTATGRGQSLERYAGIVRAGGLILLNMTMNA